MPYPERTVPSAPQPHHTHLPVGRPNTDHGPLPPAALRDGIGRFDGERHNVDLSLGGQAGIVALEPVLELVDACAVVEPSLCCGEVIEAVAFGAGHGAFS